MLFMHLAQPSALCKYTEAGCAGITHCVGTCYSAIQHCVLYQAVLQIPSQPMMQPISEECRCMCLSCSARQPTSRWLLYACLNLGVLPLQPQAMRVKQCMPATATTLHSLEHAACVHRAYRLLLHTHCLIGIKNSNYMRMLHCHDDCATHTVRSRTRDNG